MAMKTGEVALAFGVTAQTVRNWVNNYGLQDFFSEQAQRKDERVQAEYLADDLEVFKSIQTLVRRHYKWDEIKSELASGWRDTDMPSRLLVVDEHHETASSFQLMNELAVVKSQNTNALDIIKEKDGQIADLRKQIEDLLQRVEQLNKQVFSLESDRSAAVAKLAAERELGRLERELELMQQGRIKPAASGDSE